MSVRLQLVILSVAALLGAGSAPSAAQDPLGSVAPVVQLQTLDERLSTERETMTRALITPLSGGYLPRSSPDVLATRVIPLTDLAAHHDRVHRHNRLLGNGLLALGAAAVVGSLFDYAARGSLEATGLEAALLFGGFGAVVLGDGRHRVAERALARAEESRKLANP